MGPRVLPILMQILAHKGIVHERDRAVSTYIELLSRLRPPAGIIKLDHPTDHAKRIGRSPGKWTAAMKQLERLQFIQLTTDGDGRFTYALVINPYTAVSNQLERSTDPELQTLWNMFRREWIEADAHIPEVAGSREEQPASSTNPSARPSRSSMKRKSKKT
jgi:hypothetical protein